MSGIIANPTLHNAGLATGILGGGLFLTIGATLIGIGATNVWINLTAVGCGVAGAGVLLALLGSYLVIRAKRLPETSDAKIKVTSPPPVGKQKAEETGRRRFNESEGNRFIHDKDL